MIEAGGAAVERRAWLVDLQYRDGAATRTVRWTDSADPVAVAGEGVYSGDNPIVALGGIGASIARLERREWFLALADPDGVWQARFAANWRRRRCRIHLCTWPGPVVTPWRVGWCVGRQTDFAAAGDGGAPMRQTQLRFAGAFARALSSRKRFLTDEAQRRVDATDTGLAHAQTTIDVNWGGN